MIIDTDFFSSFLKINKLKLILKSLNITHLIIPSTVYEELKDSLFFNENNHLFTYDKNNLNGETYVLIKKVNLDNLSKYFNLEKIKKLGDGEKGCFLLTKETKDKILIDDKQARRIAKEENLKVMSITSFLLDCKKRNILSLEEIKQIINELKEKDYYEFSEEVNKELLK